MLPELMCGANGTLVQKRLFQFAVLVTDWHQYQLMSSSFAAAGFGPGVARFSPVDNAVGNRSEPFSLINSLLAEDGEPYVVLCHQDVRADQGYGFSELVRALDLLNELDQFWAVAGNAGCTDDFEFVLQVRDPNYLPLWTGALPIEVHSLDENFLVLRRGMGLQTSRELDGFHLYGTDLCLNARLRGLGCYVIPFLLTHLSAGNFSGDFKKSRERFIARWSREFRHTWVVREAEFFLTKYPALRKLGDRGRIKNLLLSSGIARRFLNWELSRLRLRNRQVVK